MSLSHQLAERKKDNEDPDCVVEALSTQSPGFVEFFDRPLSRQGFALSHLLHYRLAPREAAAGDGTDAAPQVLTLGFSTADIIVTGWRLERAAEFLQAGTLAAVKTIPARHVTMTGNRPAVVSIEIRALGPGKGGL